MWGWIGSASTCSIPQDPSEGIKGQVWKGHRDSGNEIPASKHQEVAVVVTEAPYFWNRSYYLRCTLMTTRAQSFSFLALGVNPFSLWGGKGLSPHPPSIWRLATSCLESFQL